MRRTWTIIGVADVRRSFEWYRRLLVLPAAQPAHEYFGQLLDTDGEVLLCVHAWGEHEHPSLSDPARAMPGHGLLLFFRVDEFEASLAAARSLSADAQIDVQRNPATGTAEFSLRDPDGYHVTVSALRAA